MKSDLKGNIRDINQLIAYIARDVYEGDPNRYTAEKSSENRKKEKFKEALNNWKKDYEKKYPNAQSGELFSINREALKEKLDNLPKEEKVLGELADSFKKKIVRATSEVYNLGNDATKISNKLNCDYKVAKKFISQ